MNPFVFIVGCPRSGTTLLQRMVDAHKQIAITPETHWIPSFFRERTGLTLDGLVTPALVPRLLEYHTFPKLGIGRKELEGLLGSGELVSYARFVSGIFDLYGRAQAKELVGDKTPEYGRSIPVLHTLWPKAKFVHLIRDGRDVCLSAINWKKKVTKLTSLFESWAEDSVTTAALWWKWHVRLAQEAGQALGPDLYYEIRYEAVIDQPAEACAGLCAFLGVPYDGAMLRFYEGRTRAKPGLDAKHAWVPITAGLRDWRSQMPAANVARFEAAAGDFLDSLGYPRGAPQPSVEMLEYVTGIRERFSKDSCSYSLRSSISQP